MARYCVVNTRLSNPNLVINWIVIDILFFISAYQKKWIVIDFFFISAYQKKPDKMQQLSMPLQFILLFYLAIMFYFSSYTRRRPI
jgi:hypothetical protein